MRIPWLLKEPGSGFRAPVLILVGSVLCAATWHGLQQCGPLIWAPAPLSFFSVRFEVWALSSCIDDGCVRAPDKGRMLRSR